MLNTLKLFMPPVHFRQIFTCTVKAISMPDLSEYMTVKEAAEKLGFTPRGVQVLIKKSKLDAVFLGRMYLVSRKSVNDYSERTQGLNKRDPTRGRTHQE
ncbi:MAG: hypothetical protein OHK0052_20510 [Anaerolineales bacterium]